MPPPYHDHLLRSGLLDDPDLVIGQVVQFVHQPVDLPVGGVDLALEDRLVMRGRRTRTPTHACGRVLVPPLHIPSYGAVS